MVAARMEDDIANRDWRVVHSGVVAGHLCTDWKLEIEPRVIQTKS